MAVNPRKLTIERQRQKFASDKNFLKRFFMYFELKIPESSTPSGNPEPGGSFLFPLVRGPSSYKMSEPFAVEKTHTLGGGLYVEENGIIARTITISGTTGFAPRFLNDVAATPLSSLKPEKRSFQRDLRGRIIDAISGHMHFMYLQDAVFRTYADYKKDPATSEATSMIFHNPKDQESWLVVPERFDLERDASSKTRTQYQYTIELTAVGPAALGTKDFSSDGGLLGAISDAKDTINKGFELAQGAINDINSLRNSMTGIVPNLGLIISSATDILNSVGDFLNGVTEAILSPLDFLDNTAQLIEGAMSAVNNIIEGVNDIANLPNAAIQKFRQLSDGLDTIGQHPSAFATPNDRKLKQIKKSQSLLTALTTEDRATAVATAPPSTFFELNSASTAPTRGDIQSAAGTVTVGSAVQNYTGTVQRRLSQGDSLISLAAKYLGDARLWQHIAIANNLKPPFVTELANIDILDEADNFPGTLGIGQTILIPTFAKAPETLPVLAVIGARPEEDVATKLLGTDWELTPVAGNAGGYIYDIPVDAESGSTDAATVSGVANLSQALQTRATTEKGTDTLYKNLGLGGVIGTGFFPTDIEAARQKYIDALTQDPRVSAVRRIDLEASDPQDALILDADIEVRGFSENVNVKNNV